MNEELQSANEDPETSREELVNLIRNAIEAIQNTGVTGGTITVTSNMHAEGDKALVSVCDSGPGIDAGSAAGLFGDLASKKEYGLGVGLRISHSLIGAQGGRIWLEHRTQGAMIFCFTLPLAS
jgi:C4-dicarboxylate-specific signal transduction histidine kinase